MRTSFKGDPKWGSKLHLSSFGSLIRSSLFPRFLSPTSLSLRRKTVSVPGTAAVVESRSRRRELIEQVAEETTLAHARQFAEQNEDNWIISEELLLPLPWQKNVMDGNLSLRAVINYDEGYQAPTVEKSTGLSHKTCLTHGESLLFLPY